MTLLSGERRRLLAAKLRGRGIGAAHLDREKERARAPSRRPLPRLSFAQQRLWVLDRLEPGNPFYNISGLAELEGPLEAATLARAFSGIVRRHEALRTTFAEQGGVPYQVIAPPPDPAAWPLPVIDLAGLPVGSIRRETERLALAEARTPMDLARGPLVRTSLVRCAAAAHTLLVTLHHIIADGWSSGVFLREMAALYEAFAAGRASSLPELPLQYADFAEQQLEELQGELLERELAWWRQRLTAAPVVLELPTDRPRPPRQTFHGARFPLDIPPERSAALHRLARQENATLFMVLITAFGALLRSWTGQEDLLVGVPIASRRRPELEGIIGFLSNTLALRLKLAGDPTFRGALGRVREMAHDAYAHQDLPFEKLVEEQRERDPSRSPLVQVLAVLQNAPPGRAEMSRVNLRRLEFDPGIAKLDLLFDLTEVEEPEDRAGGLRGAFEFNTDLFDRTTIQRLAERFERLLETVAAAPDRRLSDLPLLPEPERHLVVEEWGVGRSLPAVPPSVVDLMEEQAGRTPDAPAVLGIDGESLSYRELHARANRLARHLLKLDLNGSIGRGSRVAFALDRSPELAITLLALLKTGAAYVPVDPSWPAGRRAFLLEDSGASRLLTRGDLDGLDLSAESPLPPKVPISPDDLAYVLYTSGSTGQPNGIAMRHGALAWLIGQQLASTPGPWRTLQYTSPGFDVSFQEIVSTWAAGGTLVLVYEEERRDPAALLARLREARIERLFLPFVALQQLAEAARGAALPESLREVVTAGEQLQITPAVAGLFARLPGARLHNHYGPAETHVVTTSVLDGDPGAWPALPSIGRPVAGARILVPTWTAGPRRSALPASSAWAAPCSPAAISTVRT